jgi:aspartate kinase
LSLEAGAGAGLLEAGGDGGVLDVGFAIRDEHLDGHPLGAGKAKRLLQQRREGVGVALDLGDVDGLGTGVVADEADDFLLALGDSDGAVVNEIAHHVPRGVGQLRQAPGVGLDGVPQFHTRHLGAEKLKAVPAAGKMDTVIHGDDEAGANSHERHVPRGGRMRVVVKFGGTSVADGDRINRAADSIATAVEAGHEVAVVVSAMGSTTDTLIDEMKFDASEEDRAEIVSMGERTSVRMLKGALESRGIDASFLEPGRDDWPIITDEYGEVDVEETRGRAQQCADRMSEGVVPVLTGFLAQDHDGTITTLGRGGSDTTAVMLGNYMDADEVVIVTDVEGVMTGDPDVVEGARNVGEITVDELRNLSFRGAEVVAPSALAYKTDGLTVRVVHYQHDDLLAGGTSISGEFQNLIDLHESELVCLTAAGRAVRNQPGILATLSSALGEAGINIQTVSSGMDSITFYVDADHAERAEALMHEEVVADETLSSITREEEIAVVRVTGNDIQSQTDAIQQVLAPLAEERIYLYDVVTSATSVAVFVPWKDREEALDCLQDVF